METIECIKTRRTIRNFENKPVSKEIINKLVELASYSPSWKNSQTCRYVVVNEELKQKIAQECTMGFDWNKNIILNAPCLIILLTINNISGYNNDKTPTTSKEKHWQSFDAGINAQTFSLSAHALGLGSVIMGIYDEEKVKKTLQLDDNFSISALIALGYPKEQPQMPKRKDIESLIIYK